MNKKYLTLISRIKDELSEIQQIVNRSQKAWENANLSNDDLYLDSVALNLHGFYAGLERIFELIANDIDQSLPGGETWHQSLLKQMSTEIEEVRPPVISKNTYNKLDDYRGFRHIVRNVYTFQLSKRRIKPLVEELPELFEQIKQEINQFIEFIKKNVEETE